MVCSRDVYLVGFGKLNEVLCSDAFVKFCYVVLHTRQEKRAADCIYLLGAFLSQYQLKGNWFYCSELNLRLNSTLVVIPEFVS